MGPFADGWTESDIEASIRRNDPDELLYVPIVVGMSADECEREWVEDVCVKLSEHPHFNVRGNAVLAFGHIARTCRALDLERIVPIISGALNDPHEYVRSHAAGAAADLEMYLGVVVPGHDGKQTQMMLEAIEKLRQQHNR
jgi:hypothetical protein